MHTLRRAGWFTEAEITAWKKLRNTVTHGNYDTTSGGINRVVQRLYSVTTMINKVVMLAIDYGGPFVSHSERGWPVRHLGSPKGPSTVIRAESLA